MTLRSQRLIDPQSVLHAKALSLVSLRVEDVARSSEFYQRTFGMRVVSEAPGCVDLAFGAPVRRMQISRVDGDQRHSPVDQIGFAVEESLTEIASCLERYLLEGMPSNDASWMVRHDDRLPVLLHSERNLAPLPVAQSADSLFQATAVNHVAYHVRDYAAARDFFMDLLGMQVVFEDGKKCAVACGDPLDSIFINQLKQPGDGFIDHVAFSIAGFDRGLVEERLTSSGLPAEQDGSFAWTTTDPDGYRVQICAERGVYPGAASDPYHE